MHASKGVGCLDCHQAKAAGAELDAILARPEHAWYLEQRAQHALVKGEAIRPPARTN